MRETSPVLRSKGRSEVIPTSRIDIANFLLAAVLFSSCNDNHTKEDYSRTRKEVELSEEQEKAYEQLYSGDGSMLSHMTDRSGKYFEIQWSDDGKNISLSIIQYVWNGETGKNDPSLLSVLRFYDRAKFSDPIKDFDDLLDAVRGLPSGATLFYIGDDVGPIINSITRSEKLLIDLVMRKFGGKFVCIPGG